MYSTKQVNNIIIQESGIQYHQIYIYTLLRKWGFKQKVPRRVHVNTASKEEKRNFKKEQERYYEYSPPPPEGGFTVISTDESFSFFDSLVRRVWIRHDERPVVRITGSHKESVLFGATV